VDYSDNTFACYRHGTLFFAWQKTKQLVRATFCCNYREVILKWQRKAEVAE
jgi:hypothetical protein